MNVLSQYGADPRRFEEAAAFPGLCLCRVVSQYKDQYKLVTQDGECMGEVSGKFRYEAGPTGRPAVGDYVMASVGNGLAVIHALLSRRSAFERAAAGEERYTQVVAANIDVAFVCMSLNNNYSLSRMERYLSVSWNSGAVPVVLLTKADLAEDLAGMVAQARAAAPGTEVIPLSKLEGDPRKVLSPYLGEGKTACFLGSSGVGKSTLINLLLGEELLKTSQVREDGKGRHTTTRRELHLLPGGGVVIDTPGMRELGVEAVDLSRSFPDIDALVQRCRFGDCTHTGEPGCAVLEALRSGTLDERRLESYKKLKREARYDGLSGKALEKEKLGEMLKEVGGMKKFRKYIRETDKRKGE